MKRTRGTRMRKRLRSEITSSAVRHIIFYYSHAYMYIYIYICIFCSVGFNRQLSSTRSRVDTYSIIKTNFHNTPTSTSIRTLTSQRVVGIIMWILLLLRCAKSRSQTHRWRYRIRRLASGTCVSERSRLLPPRACAKRVGFECSDDHSLREYTVTKIVKKRLNARTRRRLDDG